MQIHGLTKKEFETIMYWYSWMKADMNNEDQDDELFEKIKKQFNFQNEFKELLNTGVFDCHEEEEKKVNKKINEMWNFDNPNVRQCGDYKTDYDKLNNFVPFQNMIDIIKQYYQADKVTISPIFHNPIPYKYKDNEKYSIINSSFAIQVDDKVYDSDDIAKETLNYPVMRIVCNHSAQEVFIMTNDDKCEIVGFVY